MGEKLQTSTARKVTVKFLKGLTVVAGILIVIVLAAYIILDLYLDSSIKSRLEKEVHQASNGLYLLDIGYLHISLSDFSVVAKDIHFTTDSSRYQALQKEKGKMPDYYQVSAQKFYISDLNVWPLLWGKGVHIPKVVLSRPDIYAITHPGNSQQKQKKPLLLNLHQKLGNYVSWLTIDSMTVEEGRLQYIAQSDSGKTSVEVPSFLLSFYKVLIDEEASKDTNRVLYTRDILLKAEEGMKVTTGTFTLITPFLRASTAQGTFIQDMVYSTANSQNNKADIRVPTIRLGYLDWRKLLQNEGLYIPRIHAEQPTAEIIIDKSSTKQTNKQSKQPSLALHKLIATFVPSARIDSISLYKGNLQLTLAKASSDTDLTIENFDLLLKDVLIDSAAAQNPNRILYTKDIQLVVHDLLQGGNELYTIEAKYLKASTLQGLQAEGVTVHTNESARHTHQQAPIYEIYIPSLSADFTDWGALTENQGVFIPTVQIIKPEAKIIVRSQHQSKGKNKETQKALHQLISPYVPWLKIDRIQVENGDLTIVQAAKKGNPALTISNFYLTGKDMKIDSDAASDKGRFLYTKEVKLEVKDYTYVTKKQQKLTIGYLRASNQTGAILRNLQISKEATSSGNNSGMLYQIGVPFMQINFTDWHALIEGKAARVPLVEIKKPEAVIRTISHPDSIQKQQQKQFPQKNLLTLHKQVSPFIPWLSIDSVRLLEGSIKYVQDKDSVDQMTYRANNLNLTMADVRIDSVSANSNERVFYSQYVQVVVKDSITFTNSTYHLSADSLYTSTGKGVGIVNLQLSPRTSQISGSREKQLFEVSIPQFYAAFTDWGNFMQANEVHLPTVQIENPSVKVIASKHSGSGSDDTDANTDTESNYPQKSKNSLSSLQNAITRYVSALTIDSINLDKGNFRYVQQPGQLTNFTDSANDIYLTFRKVRIDSSADAKGNRVLFTEDIRFRIVDFKRLTKDSLYTLAVENLNGSTAEKTLYIDSLKMTPRYPVKEFFQKAGGQQDILKLKMKQLNVKEINFDELFVQQNLVAGYVMADSILLEIFRDRRVPPQKTAKPLLLEAFRQMNTYVRLDSVSLINGYISYSEIPQQGDKPGKMFFEDITATITNVTNDSTLVSLDDPIVIEADALLMGEGKTNLTLKVPLFNDTHTFQYMGSIGQMDLKALNPVLENTAFIRIRSGKLDELTVRADANHDKAKGIMCAFYKDFEVELLAHEPGQEDNLWKDISTFMANKFVLRNSNRRKRYDFNPGSIQIEPQKGKSALNYFWATIRSGIYGSIGYKKAKKILPFL